MQPQIQTTVSPAGRGNLLLWLGVCAVAGLLIAPIFHSMPPRMKFLGLHSWALAACVAVACSWSARSFGVRSRLLVAGVSVVVALVSLGLLAHWGYNELKRETAQRMPMIPFPQQVGSPEQMARSMQVQRELAQALVPTFTDYQRRRMNSPTLRRVRPLVLWCGDLFLSAVVCVLISSQAQRQRPETGNSGSVSAGQDREADTTS